MKKIVLILLGLFILGISNHVYSQDWVSTSKGSYDIAAKVKESKFIVALLDQQDAMNDSLKKAMKKYWTFCEFDYATATEANEYMAQYGYTVFTIAGEGMEGGVSRYSYQLIWGTEKNKKVIYGKLFGTVLPSMKNKSKKIVLNNYDYLLPYIVKKTNDYLEQNYKSNGKESKDNSDDRSKKDISYFRGGHAKLEKSKIIVCEDGITDKEHAIKVIATVTRMDKSKIEVVSRRAIIKAIAHQEENLAVFIGNSGNNYEVFYVKGLIPLADGCPFDGNIYKGK
jgi:hypothetical protein